MNKRLTISVLAALLCAVLPAQELPRAEIAQQPPCVHVDRAGLHFPGSRDAQDHFYGLLDSLMAGSGQSVNIWHVGGSHVQAGHFSYRLQERLTTMADSLKGERGFIFPYRIAKTNSDKSFRTSFTGEWLSAMAASTHKDLNPRFGIMGIAAQTSDSLATVGIGLNISADTLWRFNRFRILGYASSPDVRPYLVSGSDTLDFVIDTETQSYIFDLPAETDTVTIGFHIPEGQSFTLTGTEPISGRKGINYYCSGVNGARLTTWLEQCPDLPRDLQLVKPDLAIFAVGINDSACKAVDFKPEVFKENYRRLIRLIREQSPDCAFVFITNNDSYRYISRGMTYNHNGPTVQKAMFELAKEYGAAVWDVYDIMGGKDSVIKWRNAGLVKSDRLHFTQEGYVLLGDMLYNALVDDYNAQKR
jgi:lysophospholipase L1-like esterase